MTALKGKGFFASKHDWLVPEGLFHHTDRLLIHDIADRVLHILGARDLREINDAVDGLAWILFETRPDYEAALPTRITGDKRKIQKVVIRDADRLLFAMGLVDIDQRTGPRRFTWPEYFAVRALTAVHRGINATQYVKSEPEPQSADTIYSRLGIAAYHFLSAIETVCVAESLQREEVAKHAVQPEENKKYTFDPVKAAKVRHAPANALKEEFIRYYQAHRQECASKTQAARRFYNSLESSRQETLKPSNAIETLTKALTDHEKGRLQLSSDA